MLKNDSVSNLGNHTPKPVAGGQERSLSVPNCCVEGENDGVPDSLNGEDEVAASYRLNREKWIRVATARGIWDPEALVQEVYLSIGKSAKSMAYLPLRLKCRIFSKLRQQARISANEVRLQDEAMEQLVAPCSEEAFGDSRSELERITNGLSVEHRDVLDLHHLQGIGIAELAKRMNRSEKAVKSLLMRARTRAKRIGLRLRAGTCD